MENRLKTLAEFIKTNQKWLGEEHKRLDEKIGEWEKKNPDAEDWGMDSYSWFEEEILKHRDFDSAFFNSQMLITYSWFEVTLKEICLETEKYIDSKIGLNDLSGGNYIEKSKKFINKVLGIDTSYLNDKWEKISRYQKIRNAIAHDNGSIPDDKLTGFKTIIRQFSHIEISDELTPELKITDAEFVIEFCKIADEYVCEVMKRIIQKLSENE
ncbi:MAG: hypothetical protein EPGJADBJ_02348 [Saprospiraceae bacterium]|nr:hypothetical protein [Saprospiraceae bacterium]